MQGIYPRFKTKKAFAAAVAADPSAVSFEATSLFGNEYDGPLTGSPAGRFPVVGPSPTERVWYANVVVGPKGVQVK